MLLPSPEDLRAWRNDCERSIQLLAMLDGRLNEVLGAHGEQQIDLLAYLLRDTAALLLLRLDGASGT